jgi:hypothetical protein
VKLLDMLLSNTQLRDEFREDPDAVAQRAGVVLDEDTREALLSVDWSASNEELRERLSKSLCTS